MKRLISVILCMLLMLLCACSQPAEVEENSEPPEPSAVEEQTEQSKENEVEGEVTPTQSLEPSTNKEVVTEQNAPTVYWTMDVAYHLENCPELSKKENTKVTWKMVKEVGLRQCPICNPPQYEDYIDIE